MSLQDELAEAKARIQALEGIVGDLLGPDPDIPEGADVRRLDVARPPLVAAYWQQGPWRCLRVEEPTVGYDRPSIFLIEGKVRVRQVNAVERWMRWGAKILEAFEVEPVPADRQVRVVFLPGLVWTFLAWREVERIGVLHHQDPDNAVKPTLDFAQTAQAGKSPRPFGAFVNDTQVVDLMVYRIPQAGAAAVDRQAITRARSRDKKKQQAAKRREAQED